MTGGWAKSGSTDGGKTGHRHKLCADVLGSEETWQEWLGNQGARKRHDHDLPRASRIRQADLDLNIPIGRYFGKVQEAVVVRVPNDRDSRCASSSRNKGCNARGQSVKGSSCCVRRRISSQRLEQLFLRYTGRRELLRNRLRVTRRHCTDQILGIDLLVDSLHRIGCGLLMLVEDRSEALQRRLKPLNCNRVTRLLRIGNSRFNLLLRHPFGNIVGLRGGGLEDIAH